MGNKTIVVINGNPKSGKDTFVELCSKYAKVVNISYIDYVKDVAKYIGWDGSKEERDRKFLSDLDEIISRYNDNSFKNLLCKINDFAVDENDILFIHIRKPSNIKRLKKVINENFKNINFETLLIKRDKAKILETNESDRCINNYDYDIFINNNYSIKELEDVAIIYVDFVKKIKD